MALRPVGDLPPRVYWVRRLVLLVGLILLVLVVWWLWPGGGDDTTATSGQQPSPTPSVSTTPSISPGPSESTTSKSPKPSDPPCDDSDIDVTVRTDSSSYPAGEDPSITFTVKSDTNQTCVRDVGSAANELRITSGGATVWSSDYCKSEETQDPQALGPGDDYVQTYQWTRVLSSKECPTPLEQADPGTYQVVAINGDVTSEPVEFVLE